MTGGRPRNRWRGVDLPPGQRAVAELRRSSAAPPEVTTADWTITVVTEDGSQACWDWPRFRSLPSEPVALDLHCVDGWSVLGSRWDATSVHELFKDVHSSAEFALVDSYADYTTNLPLEDLLEMPAWLAFAREGRPLAADRGGPVRLLVPHLYLWKSVKWVRRITLSSDDRPGTRERAGYHNYGDPWREQRTAAHRSTISRPDALTDLVRDAGRVVDHLPPLEGKARS